MQIWVLRKTATEKVTPDAVNWLPHHVDREVIEAVVVRDGV